MVDPKERLLRVEEVLEIGRISKSVLYVMVKEAGFPRQVRIGKRAVGWLQGDIEAWLESLSPATEANWR